MTKETVRCSRIRCVETGDERAFLTALERDEMRDLIFSRPLPPDDVGPLIAMGFSASVAA